MKIVPTIVVSDSVNLSFLSPAEPRNDSACIKIIITSPPNLPSWTILGERCLFL